MSDEVLEALIKKALSGGEDHISFSWQGGEPTLMGLQFYERAVYYQSKYGTGKSVGNGFQTNGILLNKEWTEFFKVYNFLVGISIDGPRHIHDHYRRDRGGEGSWTKVHEKVRLLIDNGVDVNAIGVVNNYSVRFPEEIYNYYKNIGLTFMQFISVVERDKVNPKNLSKESVDVIQYGEFLIRLFDCWRNDIKDNKPTTYIRWFDAIFYRYVGMNPPDCTLEPECGVYIVVEHNGDVYACDFFVELKWKLGNVLHNNLVSMLNSKRQSKFGAIKTELPKCCLHCSWLRFCYNGCPKDRTLKSIDNIPLNILCEAYKMFFTYSDDWFREYSKHWIEEQRSCLD
jgi:uncharacterized protein